MKKAENLGLSHLVGMSKPDLVVNITRRLVSIDNSVKVIGSGVVEVLNEGFAFIRSSAYNYLEKLKQEFPLIIKSIKGECMLLGIEFTPNEKKQKDK